MRQKHKVARCEGLEARISDKSMIVLRAGRSDEWGVRSVTGIESTSRVRVSGKEPTVESEGAGR